MTATRLKERIGKVVGESDANKPGVWISSWELAAFGVSEPRQYFFSFLYRCTCERELCLSESTNAVFGIEQQVPDGDYVGRICPLTTLIWVREARIIPCSIPCSFS